MQLAVNVSPWYFRISACNEIWLNLVRGDIAGAAHRFIDVEPLIEESLKNSDTFLVTKVSLLNAQGKYPDILAELEEVVYELEQMGKYWVLMNLLPFQSLALHALGREEEAIDVISHCLAFAAPEGYVRIFVDRGAPMARLLQIASSRGIETDYISGLLSAFNIPVASDQPGMPISSKTHTKIQSASLTEPLSEREIQVLRLLDSPLTSEEIGRELYVSVNTIRTHIRNIYAKLGVKRRGDAVWRAKELKLM
jgi:LuxR family maltose regulon positive regulatory protein